MWLVWWIIIYPDISCHQVSIISLPFLLFYLVISYMSTLYPLQLGHLQPTVVTSSNNDYACSHALLEQQRLSSQQSKAAGSCGGVAHHSVRSDNRAVVIRQSNIKHSSSMHSLSICVPVVAVKWRRVPETQQPHETFYYQFHFEGGLKKKLMHRMWWKDTRMLRIAQRIN